MQVLSRDREDLSGHVFSYHLFQPADCSVSSNESHDESNEDDDDGVDVDDVNEVNDGNVSSTELRDIVEDASELLDNVAKVKNEIEQFQAAERAAYAQASDQVK